jgi:transposase, IS5 family
MRQAGLFGLSDQLNRLSDCGDPLETMAQVVNFEMFRPALGEALAYGDGTKGGRPPYDPVAMFKVLILAAQNTVSDARMEFLIRDRLSWLRFLSFDLGAPTPDENTIRLFREKLTRAGAIDTLFSAFDRSLRERGYLPMSGQIVDATLVAAPKQRNTVAEREAIKAGRSAVEIWPDEPARAAQKDTDARWTLKFAKARARCQTAGRGSTSPSRASGIRAASRSAGATASSDAARLPMVPASTDGCCATW